MKNKALIFVIGAIMTLGGVVAAGTFAMMTYLAIALNNYTLFHSEKTPFLAAALIFTLLCGIAQIVHGVIIMINCDRKNKKKLSFVFNIVIVAASAAAILLCSICGASLMPVQMLCGIIIPVLYFVIDAMTSPKDVK